MHALSGIENLNKNNINSNNNGNEYLFFRYSYRDEGVEDKKPELEKRTQPRFCQQRKLISKSKLCAG